MIGLWKRTAVYSAAHFIVDFSCAFLIFRYVLGAENWILCLITYNAFAFAGQLPLGLLADLFGKNRIFASLGCLTVVAAGFINYDGLILCAVAGLGNALFHIGAGRDVLIACKGRDFPLGMFVSPGALGLFFGTAAGKAGALSMWLPVALLIFSAAAIMLAVNTDCIAQSNLTWNTEKLSKSRTFALVAGACLFLVVILRSFLGMGLSFTWKGQGSFPLILVLSIVLGKALGGLLADIFGERPTAIVSLSLAAVFALLGNIPFFGILAMLLFNMTMPITLGALGRIFKGAPGLAFGLLTFGLFLGFAPMTLGGIGVSSPVFLIGCLASAALLNFALGGERCGD